MTSPHATPDDGRPSTASRARLAAELHEQLAASRMAWDAALLRSDAAIAAGDQAAADEALEDHRQLLGALEERLGAVVAAAVVAREAEDVVRAAGDADVATSPSGPGLGDGPAEAHGAPTVLTRDGRDGPVAPRGAGRRAVTSLLGAAAAVALLAGVLAGDLPLDPRGSIAGSSTGDADQLRAQVASQRVRDVLTEFGTAGDVAASQAELPTFSGSLPPAAASPAAPAGSAPDEADPAPPASEDDTSADAPADDHRTDVPALDLPTDAPTAPEQPERGPLGELLGGLDDRDGVTDDATVGRDDAADDGALERDVDTSTPRPLRDVTEQLRAPETAPSASDPTGGLG